MKIEAKKNNTFVQDRNLCFFYATLIAINKTLNVINFVYFLCLISDGLRKTALHFYQAFLAELNLGCVILLAFEEIFSDGENFSND